MAFSLGGGSTEETRLLWKLAAMGFQFGTEIIAGILLGLLVDRMAGTAPWGLRIGAIAGILVAMSHFVRQAMRVNREMDRTSPIRKPHRPPATPISPEKHPTDLPPTLSPDELPEEELTHEQWKALRDREFEQQLEDDDPRGRPSGGGGRDEG